LPKKTLNFLAFLLWSVKSKQNCPIFATTLSMGKKRKAGGQPFAQRTSKREDLMSRSEFGLEETFNDSEDEFQQGRDRILLEEGPEARRHRKLEEQGM
jgi:hypothetical protein